MILKKLLLGLVLSSAFCASAGAQTFTSEYVKLDFTNDQDREKCEDIGPPEVEDEPQLFGAAKCEGFKDFHIYVASYDLRDSLQFGKFTDKDMKAEDFWESFSYFNNPGKTFEWRLRDGEPFAVIYRHFVNGAAFTGKDGPYENYAYLIIKSVASEKTQGIGCTYGVVSTATKNANVIARHVADSMPINSIKHCGANVSVPIFEASDKAPFFKQAGTLDELRSSAPDKAALIINGESKDEVISLSSTVADLVERCTRIGPGDAKKVQNDDYFQCPGIGNYYAWYTTKNGRDSLQFGDLNIQMSEAGSWESFAEENNGITEVEWRAKNGVPYAAIYTHEIKKQDGKNVKLTVIKSVASDANNGIGCTYGVLLNGGNMKKIQKTARIIADTMENPSERCTDAPVPLYAPSDKAPFYEIAFQQSGMVRKFPDLSSYRK